MTPLAAYLAKQLAVRPKHREHIWREEQNIKTLRKALDEIHCFEVSQCSPLIGELSHNSSHLDRVFETYAFLPAPKTWVEWLHPSGKRVAILCEESEGRIKEWGDLRIAACTLFCEEMAQHAGYLSLVSGDYFDGQLGATRTRTLPNYLIDVFPPEQRQRAFPAFLSYCHLCLVMINSPQIIGREQHMPNRGLERKLTQALGAGSFPLSAWSELKLRISKPIEIDDGEPHEAHLTGRRALHFVRKHIRIRLGRLEYVNAHWRGDPAIGIKQTRYVVAP